MRRVPAAYSHQLSQLNVILSNILPIWREGLNIPSRQACA